MSSEARLVDLEARIAHQDQAISDLSREIYEQQKQLEKLEATCKYLLEQARQLPPAQREPEDENPPHY